MITYIKNSTNIKRNHVVSAGLVAAGVIATALTVGLIAHNVPMFTHSKLDKAFLVFIGIQAGGASYLLFNRATQIPYGKISDQISEKAKETCKRVSDFHSNNSPDGTAVTQSDTRKNPNKSDQKNSFTINQEPLNQLGNDRLYKAKTAEEAAQEAKKKLDKNPTNNSLKVEYENAAANAAFLAGVFYREGNLPSVLP